MASVGLRASLPPEPIDWPVWARAGISSLQIPTCHDTQVSPAVNDVLDAGIQVTFALSPPPIGTLRSLTPVDRPDERIARPDADLPWGAVIDAAPVETALLAHVGQRVGPTVLSPLDCFAMSLPLQDQAFASTIGSHGGDAEKIQMTVSRYLRGRQGGWVPAGLDTRIDAVRLLLADDTEPLLTARREALAESATRRMTTLRDAGATAVAVEANRHMADVERLVERLVSEQANVIGRTDGSLSSILTASCTFIRAGAIGIVIEAPSAALPNSERLADALDLCEGAGATTIVISSNPGWLADGAREVGRAIHRLHGRPGSLEHERQRRWETVRG